MGVIFKITGAAKDNATMEKIVRAVKQFRPKDMSVEQVDEESAAQNEELNARKASGPSKRWKEAEAYALEHGMYKPDGTLDKNTARSILAAKRKEEMAKAEAEHRKRILALAPKEKKK